MACQVDAMVKRLNKQQNIADEIGLRHVKMLQKMREIYKGFLRGMCEPVWEQECEQVACVNE